MEKDTRWRKNPKKKKRKKLINTLLEDNFLGRKILFHFARKKAQEKTKGHYPAIPAIIDVLESTYGANLHDGLKAEKDKFVDLATGKVSQNLVQLFFSNELIKKLPGCPNLDIKTSPPTHAGVLGAGIMGGGIAWLFSSKKIPVRLRDLNHEALQKGYQSADDYFSQLVKRRRMKKSEKSMAMQYISSDLSLNGFDRMEVVVEAIVENMDIKKKALAELEQSVSDTCVICSNTSALSIDEMASALQKPERFLGMHFFNPVNRMPLVEIIPGSQTSDEALFKACQWVKQMGKTAIIVKNCAGFLVNRILLTYMNEAARTLNDGAELQHVDELILEFGMPMGPFTLADEVGLDVGLHVAQTLEEAYGERMKVAPALELIHDELKFLGKKQGKGFYTWNGKEKEVNERVTKALQSSVLNKNLSDTIIVERCLFIMLNEAALCLSEKIVDTPEQLDMAMIMGTGFPPFKGGLLKYADHYGIKNCVQTMENLAKDFGERFNPAPLLVEMAEQGYDFYTNRKPS